MYTHTQYVYNNIVVVMLRIVSKVAAINVCDGEIIDQEKSIR